MRLKAFAVVILVLTFTNIVAPALDFGYHDYKKLTTYLKDVAKKFPKITNLYTVGKSVQGRELWVLSITGCDTKEEGNTTTVNPSTTGYTTITTSRSTTTLPTTSSSTTRTTTRAPTNVPGPTTFMPVMTTRHMNTTVTITTIKTSTESEITTDVTTANTTMLSTTNATEEKEEKKLCPQVKYVGNMHGNEVIGREVLLHLIEQYTAGYGNDKDITKFLDTTYVHIMPTMNPDGFEIGIEGDCVGVVGRYNAKRVDLNRNFKDYFQNNAVVTQPETSAIMKWLKANTFILSANLHGGSLVANYPYDNYKAAGPAKLAPSPDDDLFRHISSIYAKTHTTMSLGKACPQRAEKFPGGITNGAKWYPVKGGMQDYNYLFDGCMEITLELSCCKYPKANLVAGFWKQNKKALTEFLKSVHKGVKGCITDADTGKPIPRAKLYIVGRKVAMFKSSKKGEYWRMLMPGNFEIMATADGYEEKKKAFKVAGGAVTRLDIELKTGGKPKADEQKNDKSNTENHASFSEATMFMPCLIVFNVFSQVFI